MVWALLPALIPALTIAVTNVVIAIAGYRKQEIKLSKEAPFVTVISCAWNEGAVIERKIKNYLSLDYPEGKREIIIIDNGSSDATQEVCKRYEKRKLIKYYRLEPHNEFKSPGLDYVIEHHAKGDIILHSDADSVCERAWIKKMITGFSDERVAAVAGVTHCSNYYVNAMTRLRALEDSWLYSLSNKGNYALGGTPILCGANYAMKKSLIKNVGYHGRDILEDYALMLKLTKKGYRIVTVEAQSWQEEVESLSQYFRQRKRWLNPIAEPKRYAKYNTEPGIKSSFLNACRGAPHLPVLLAYFLLPLNPYWFLVVLGVSVIPYLLAVIHYRLYSLLLWILPAMLIEPLLFFIAVLSNIIDGLRGKRVRWLKIIHPGRALKELTLKRLN